jgi:hypothetical protein
MKKLLLIANIVFLLISCDSGTHDYSVTFTNESSKTVSFEYDGTSDTISIGDSKTYQVKAYTKPPVNIVDQNGIASIDMNKILTTADYTFFDKVPFNLNVINKLPTDITIKADNFIDNSGSTEMFIEKDNEATALIFTNKPKFTTTSNYPVIFDFNISDVEMWVILR